MVSLFFAFQHVGNIMKNNTIDDAGYIINCVVFIIIIQYVTNPRHSHSIVNKQFLSFYIQWLIFLINTNTMKNTMLKKSFKILKKIAD